MANRICLYFYCFFVTAACGKEPIANQTEERVDSTPPPAESKELSLAEIKLQLVDQNATDETAALFYNLKQVAETHILFGHQDATKRGVDDGTEWANEQHLPSVSTERSDVKNVTGTYPAVYGHDFNHIAGFFDPSNGWFGYEKEIARRLTIEAYDRGGINTYSWHYGNPVSGGSFYWSDSPIKAVHRILPGGDYHDVYKNSLKTIADYAKSLIGANGKPVPILFRPFHEFDGDWFWWGRAHCTAEEYKQLFQFTVTYLRDELGVRNFLYAWSPDRNFNTEAQYLEHYPGDAYVDLVGMDNYGDLQTSETMTIAAQKMKIVSDYAEQHQKVAALTETGLSNLGQANWYTAVLLKALQHHPVRLSYVLVWANRKDSFWTPYKGHPAEADFLSFKNNDYIYFADEMPDMYQLPQVTE
ncbi:MAG TPA: glycosyl hydrolase [Parapedobacter sp.]|uniref:glycoside hydrolase family 26 protein n=1 Tax=Parapedobacter sp. TaxID=1958893 RepID=UPI002BF95F08|nr:glycosyl hydrolase [Parapedobacter sp.]HWK56728.1 glycosyl hydrolase [Parapedobacter sp.]